MTTSRMDMLVNARNNASGVFKEVRGDLDQLNNTAKLVSGGLAGIAAAIGVDAVINLGKAAFDLGRDAQGVAALRSSFDDLASSIGSTGPKLLESLQSISQGMISQQDLIMSANRAVVLGVTDNQQKMEQLMQVAITRGRTMGLSATQAFNDLVTGLGRMSPLILDNLGIVTGGEKVFKDYAAAVGKTAETLTDAEKKQALFNKVLAESKDMLAQGIQGNPFSQMDAALSDFRLQLGTSLAPMAGEIAKSVADALRQITVDLREADTAGFESVGQQWGYVLGKAMMDEWKEATQSGDGFKLSPNPIFVAGMEFGEAMRAGMRAADLGTADPERQEYVEQNRRQFEELAQVQERVRLLYVDLATAQADYNAYAAQTPPNLEWMELLSANMARTRDELAPLQAQLAAAASAFSPMTAAAARNAEALDDNTTSAWDAVTGWQTFGGATTTGAAAQAAAIPVVANMTEQLKQQAAAAQAAAAQLQGMYLSAVSALGATQAFNLAQSGQAELKGMEDMWVRQGIDPDKIRYLRAEWLANQQKLLQWDIDAPQRAADAANAQADALYRATEAQRSNARESLTAGEQIQAQLGNYSTRGGEAQKAFEKMGDALKTSLTSGGVSADALGEKIDGIRSKVASLIQQSLTLDVSWPGKDGAEGERRGDAINENARRLAAIANEGLNGQSWLKEFAEEAPGTYADLMLKIAEGMDARGAAQYLLGEFQAGLRPDLLDFSQIKEKVKQSLLGDMRISAMTDQLTQELVAELGVSAQQVQKALGEVTGGELGNGSGVNVGPVAVDGLGDTQGQIDSLRAQLSGLAGAVSAGPVAVGGLSEALAQIDGLRGQLAGLAGTISAGPVSVGGIDAALGQIDALRGQLAGLSGTINAGPVAVGGIDAALGQIDSLRGQLAGLSGTINAGPVAVGGIDAALGQIDSLRGQLSGLAGAVTIGPVTVAGLDTALAQIDGLRSRLAELTGGQAEADAATQGVGAGEVLVPVRLSGDLQAELDDALAALRVSLVSLPLHVSGDLQGEIDALLSAVRGGAVAVPAHLTGDLQGELDTAVAALRGGEIAVSVRAASSVQTDVDGALAALTIGGVSVPVSLSGDLQAELSAAVAAVRVDGLAIPVSIAGDLQAQIESAARGVTPPPLVVPLQLADDLQSRINAAVQAVAAGVITVAVRLDGDLQAQVDATLQAVTVGGISVPVRLSESLQADIDAVMGAVTSTSISVPVRLDEDLQAQIDAAVGMLTGGISVPVRLDEDLQAELSAATQAVTASPLAVPVALSGDLQGQTAAAVQAVTVSGLTVSVTLSESLQTDVDTAVSALALPTLSLPLRVAGDLAAQTAAAAQAVSAGEITVPAHIGGDLQSELDAAIAALQVAAVLVSVRLAGDLQAEVSAALGAVTVESVAVPVSLSGDLQTQMDALAGGVTAPTITAPVALSGDLAAELDAATRAVSANEVLVPVRLAGDLRAELDAAAQSARAAALVAVRIEGDLQAQLDAAASAANAPTITAALQLSGDLQKQLERALLAVSVPPLAVPLQLSDSLPAELAAGFAAATDGEQMVRGMVERMEASYSRLHQSGVKAGAQWGTGFMSAAETGVALPLVQLLATLVTPAVLAALAGRSSRAGAQ